MACGYQSPKWMGKCPNCGSWNQMEEIVEKASNPKHGVKTSTSSAKVQKLNDIKNEVTPSSDRIKRVQPRFRWWHCKWFFSVNRWRSWYR